VRQIEDLLIVLPVWPNGKYRSCSSKACLPAEEAVAFFERVGFTKTAS